MTARIRLDSTTGQSQCENCGRVFGPNEVWLGHGCMASAMQVMVTTAPQAFELPARGGPAVPTPWELADAYSKLDRNERDDFRARTRLALPCETRIGVAGCACRECEQASRLLQKHAETELARRHAATGGGGIPSTTFVAGPLVELTPHPKVDLGGAAKALLEGGPGIASLPPRPISEPLAHLDVDLLCDDE